MPGVRLATVKRWQEKLDPQWNWLVYKEDRGMVSEITCRLCSKHTDRLKIMRNFNNSFCVGITGSALKIDNIKKHLNSEMHKQACQIEKVQSTGEGSAPIGTIVHALEASQSEEKKRVKKLLEISYMMAREELPFSKFEKIAALEKLHGVDLGNTYINDKQCRNFTEIIGELMELTMVEKIKNCAYCCLYIDGATDVSVKEKELIYITFIDKDGLIETFFFRMKEPAHADAAGLKCLLFESFEELGLKNIKSKIVSLISDGASVNMGAKSGLVARMKADNMEWLVAVHCMNHRLKLAIKDAFKDTYLNEIVEIMMRLYYIYQNSPKRLRELKDLASICGEAINKPEKEESLPEFAKII